MSSSPEWPCAALPRAELAPRTTMRVGGQVEWLLEPADPEELREAWLAALERGLSIRLLGGGANLISTDGLLRGAVIATSRVRRIFRPHPEHEAGMRFERGTDVEEMARVAPADRRSDPRLVAWCGATLPSLVHGAQDLGWSGLEGLIGVPGTFGGGAAMNAGGRFGCLWDVIESIRVLDPDGELRDLPRADCEPGYRTGNLGGSTVVGAILRFEVQTRAEVRARVQEILEAKRGSQPLSERTSGCIFKNPDPELSDGRSAGLLLDQCGAKGQRRGDAVVSEKHANFIVNRGAATAADVLTLIEDLRDRVAQRTGILLETEVVVWRAELEG